MTTIDMYKCDLCGKVYETEKEAHDCEAKCAKTIAADATIFFDGGERVNLGEFMLGDSPAFYEITAIKVTNEKTAQMLREYLYQHDSIPFPDLTGENTIWPVTLVCDEDTWQWEELDAVIGYEEERHEARIKELESYR